MAKVKNTDSAYSGSSNSNLNTFRASGMLTEDQNKKGSTAITTTNIEVYANGLRVGLIQSLSPSESRNIVKVQELGTEGVVQSVPGNTQGGQLQVSRFAVYNNNMFRALGLADQGSGNYAITNPFKTLKHQRTPFEVSVKTDTPSDTGSTGNYEEVYLDCWLASFSKTIASNTVTITEQATIQYSDAVFKGTKLGAMDAGGTGSRATAYGYSAAVATKDNTNPGA